MDKTEIALLIASRPRAFGWLKFQELLFWLFFVLGTLSFSFTGFVIFYSFVESCIADYLIESAHVKEEARPALREAVLPIRNGLIYVSFFIAIAFFILARFCHKIIRRNHYILELEEAFANMTGEG